MESFSFPYWRTLPPPAFEHSAFLWQPWSWVSCSSQFCVRDQTTRTWRWCLICSMVFTVILIFRSLCDFNELLGSLDFTFIEFCASLWPITVTFVRVNLNLEHCSWRLEGMWWWTSPLTSDFTPEVFRLELVASDPAVTVCCLAILLAYTARQLLECVLSHRPSKHCCRILRLQISTYFLWMRSLASFHEGSNLKRILFLGPKNLLSPRSQSLWLKPDLQILCLHRCELTHVTPGKCTGCPSPEETHRRAVAGHR